VIGVRRRVADRLQSVGIDVVAAVLGLLTAALLFPMRFLASQIYIRTLPIVLGVACILYLLAARRTRESGAPIRFSRGTTRLLPSVTLLGIAVMVLAAAVGGGRTGLFYDLGAAVGALLLGQILFANDEDVHAGVALGQILAFAFVVRFAALATTPGFVGIDIWTHVPQYAGAILEQGSLAPIADEKYYASPLYHLLVVTGAQLFDVSLRTSLHLTLGVAMPLSLLLLYGTARTLLPVRWSLLATALYAVSDHVIRWGIHIIPTSMGLIFFLAVLLLLVLLMHTGYQHREFLLLVGISVAVILTHQISSFIMLVLVAACLFAQGLVKFDVVGTGDTITPLLSRIREPVNMIGLLVFDLGFITLMWSLTPYQGDTFLQTMLGYFYDTLATSAGFLNLAGGSEASGGEAAAAGGGGSQLAAELAIYFDTVGFLLLLLLAVVGCLVVLRQDLASQTTFTLLTSIVVMLFLALGLPLFGIRNFVPGRWFAFLYAPMVLVGVAGLSYLSSYLSPRVVLAGLVLFAVLFPGVMLVSSDGTPDSPVFPGERERLSYTETELAAVETIDEIDRSTDRPLYTNHPYQTVFERTGAHHAEPIELRDGRPTTHETAVYRQYQSAGASYFLTERETAANLDLSEAAVCPETTNHVYGNGDVRMCTAS